MKEKKKIPQRLLDIPKANVISKRKLTEEERARARKIRDEWLATDPFWKDKDGAIEELG